MQLTFPGKVLSIIVHTFCKYIKDHGEKVCIKYINWGWCYQFAIVMKALYGTQVEIYYDEDHCWIECNRKCYDSEHRVGCKRETIVSYGPVQQASISATIRYWSRHGASYIDMKVLRQIVKECREQLTK